MPCAGPLWEATFLVCVFWGASSGSSWDALTGTAVATLEVSTLLPPPRILDINYLGRCLAPMYLRIKADTCT